MLVRGFVASRRVHYRLGEWGRARRRGQIRRSKVPLTRVSATCHHPLGEVVDSVRQSSNVHQPAGLHPLWLERARGVARRRADGLGERGGREAAGRGEHRLARAGVLEPAAERERGEPEEDDGDREDPANRGELPVSGKAHLLGKQRDLRTFFILSA